MTKKAVLSHIKKHFLINIFISFENLKKKTSIKSINTNPNSNATNTTRPYHLTVYGWVVNFPTSAPSVSAISETKCLLKMVFIC